MNIPVIYDELIDYLVQKATPAEILAFKPSIEAENRAGDLLERSNQGSLTDAERFELEQMVYFEKRIALLKAQAARLLKAP